ncbi:FUSC family protein [Gordonia liuliyuniae]|uniref:FUSC family protein n=1 Tax=Gordonia liuliyuniae TaxID=2911517 RepID=A0ABS9IPH3_9ACTN|nr:FUSC family protein [Gordonia liuliyuniae]MCF8587451.1 FUSC family protein [Gordonia liuliyuniae]
MNGNDRTTGSTARPAAWLAENFRIKPAAIPVGHSIRSGLSVGLPFVIGALTDHVLTGMWIALATLLLAAGEREGTYRLNFWIIAVSTPIGASGYLLGFVADVPLAALIALMAALAFLAGLIAGFGPAFSVAGMQFLLVSAIAIGVPDIDWWTPLWLYFVGAAAYATLLAVEMLIDPRRPQRLVLLALLQSLEELAQARAADLADGGDRTTQARSAATTAYQNAAGRVSELPVWRMGSAGDWNLDGRVVNAAERVLAFLLAADDPGVLPRAQQQLSALAGSVRTGTPASNEPDRTDPLDGVLVDLRTALADSGGRGSTTEPLVNPAIGAEVVRAACRLGLCYAIAVGAKEYFPYSHWFWVPLTVCLVMKPDFGSVFSRAVLRVVGTTVGVALATLIIALVPKGAAIGIAIGLLSACVPWFMMRSYALQAVAIAPVVILLVDEISPGGDTANYSWQRIAATALGGAVVIVFGYLIWPHSRRAWVAQTFGEATTAIADQLRLASSAIPDDPAAAQRRHDDLVTARRRAYRALSDMQVRMSRAQSEPPPASTVALAWLPVAAAADRLADTVSAYAVARRSGAKAPDSEPGAELADQIETLGRGEPPTPVRLVAAPLDPIADQTRRLRSLLETTEVRPRRV